MMRNHHTSVQRRYNNIDVSKLPELKVGNYYQIVKDLDLRFEDSSVLIPTGHVAKLVEISNDQITLDFGPQIGAAELPRNQIDSYIGVRIDGPRETTSSIMKRLIREEYPGSLDFYPGRRIRVTSIDPAIGWNRGEKNPNFNFDVLIGKEGLIQTIFGSIKGIKTYKVAFDQGGDFIIGETEMTVLE